ncbi:hypothetical protein M9H77_30198 [Catharanthus roseus]|uniref:Uncharacterized protein n=1 Tax=Catharanthus roseus TaxID=4058 RepID=A0ACC0A0H0_CATRO|nr:hypothetical protein M9H77_30198 [Catharanthus roseus]
MPLITLFGNVKVNPFTCDLAFDIDHMLKCSSPCAYLEKQLLVLIVDGFLKALLLGNLHGFQLYHFHFKEFMWLLFHGKKMNGGFMVLKVHPSDLVKTTFENGVFELALEDLDEKLVYPISFIDYLLNHDILKDFLVQNTTCCVKLLKQSFGGILLYSLTFKEFLDELISLLYCKEELGELFPLKEIEHQSDLVTDMLVYALRPIDSHL